MGLGTPPEPGAAVVLGRTSDAASVGIEHMPVQRLAASSAAGSAAAAESAAAAATAAAGGGAAVRV